ncbi:hypothetical protein NMY22_g1302 [Coprinellus aureogranulatus]|nr:hypothetical protein NMY22_g1302 [Coprinellus aureogranulatus]
MGSHSITRVSTYQGSGATQELTASYRPEVDTSSIDEKKLLWKVDLHVIPWLTVLYLFSFLDRGSIGNAKLYGLEADLGITDRQYLLCLSMFFLPYALFEVNGETIRFAKFTCAHAHCASCAQPTSNVFLRRLKPSIWLSCMMLLWGTLMVSLLSFLDVTIEPNTTATDSTRYSEELRWTTHWYRRSETGFRVAVFFSSATIAGAFSGLLAAGIAKMDGIGGRPGWAWIFILEGIATVVLAFASFWMIEDFPDNAKFLTDTERVYVIRRLQADSKQSASGEEFKREYVWQSLRDWKTYVAMGLYMGFDGPLYAFSLFLPSIINELGYTATGANLLSVPVYVWGCLMTCVIGYLGDRTGRRCYINLTLFTVGLAAYIILVVSKSPGLSYFATYLAVSAIYPTIPWVANNVEGTYKRSVTLGMAIGFGNLNGAVTANIYRAKDRPWYRLGHGIVLMYIAIGLISTVVYAMFLARENRIRDQGKRDELIEGIENKHANEENGRYSSVENARLHKGDAWSGFRLNSGFEEIIEHAVEERIGIHTPVLPKKVRNAGHQRSGRFDTPLYSFSSDQPGTLRSPTSSMASSPPTSSPSISKEHVPTHDLETPLYRPDVDVATVDERKLMWKVDLHVMPCLTILYLFSFLDRGSIGNAKLYGLEADLGMTNVQYLITLSMFFVPYALFETLHGIAKDFGGLLTLRLLLGLAEAGLYPVLNRGSSSWYKRSETGFRVAFFFSSATIAGAFSGLLAAGIAKMDGIGGKPGWSWIFILEGLATVVVAIASFWIIEDFPDNAKFLSEEERVFIIRRLQGDSKQSAAGEEFKSHYVWQSLKDWKTYVAMGLYMGLDGPLYAFSLFLPSIINELGFTATRANLLSVPVYVWGCIMTFLIGYLGDRTGRRYYINLALFAVGLAAYIILLASRSPALSYFSTYLAIAAIYPLIPNSIAWVANNVEGSYKRSVTLGMAIGFGNLNGAVTANIYRAVDRPWYRLGHGIVLMYIAIGLICTIIYAVFLSRENRIRDQGKRDEVIEGVDTKTGDMENGVFKSVEDARRYKGDAWSGFRYTV